MKLLLLFGVLLFGAWLWRSSRARAADTVQPRPRPSTSPPKVEMVRCLHCSLHLPASEAVPGRLGVYCTADHRQLAEP